MARDWFRFVFLEKVLGLYDTTTFLLLWTHLYRNYLGHDLCGKKEKKRAGRSGGLNALFPFSPHFVFTETLLSVWVCYLGGSCRRWDEFPFLLFVLTRPCCLKNVTVILFLGDVCVFWKRAALWLGQPDFFFCRTLGRLLLRVLLKFSMALVLLVWRIMVDVLYD